MAPDYDVTVIDLGGHDDRAQRAAMTVADAALIPIGPSAFDCWMLEQGLTAPEVPSRSRDRIACGEIAALADEVVALLNGEHDA